MLKQKMPIGNSSIVSINLKETKVQTTEVF